MSPCPASGPWRYGAVEPDTVELVLVRAGCDCRVGDTVRDTILDGHTRDSGQDLKVWAPSHARAHEVIT
jgi:hypothetical protein